MQVGIFLQVNPMGNKRNANSSDKASWCAVKSQISEGSGILWHTLLSVPNHRGLTSFRKQTIYNHREITQLGLIWYFPGLVQRKVFVFLAKHPFTALYISVQCWPSRLRPPTHAVLKHSQETAIKAFPQVTQIRLVKAAKWRTDPAGGSVHQAPASAHLRDNVGFLHLKARGITVSEISYMCRNDGVWVVRVCHVSRSDSLVWFGCHTDLSSHRNANNLKQVF